MKKKNKDFITSGLSFEDFEKTLTSLDRGSKSVSELILESSAAEHAAKKKESALKKAHKLNKRKG